MHRALAFHGACPSSPAACAAPLPAATWSSPATAATTAAARATAPRRSRRRPRPPGGERRRRARRPRMHRALRRTGRTLLRADVHAGRDDVADGADATRWIWMPAWLEDRRVRPEQLVLPRGHEDSAGDPPPRSAHRDALRDEAGAGRLVPHDVRVEHHRDRRAVAHDGADERARAALRRPERRPVRAVPRRGRRLRARLRRGEPRRCPSRLGSTCTRCGRCR